MSDMAKRYDKYDTTEKQAADSAIQQLKRWIDEASYLVFFGGAGVSTESGILTSGERTDCIVKAALKLAL